jgi:hypothetical protein
MFTRVKEVEESVGAPLEAYEKTTRARIANAHARLVRLDIVEGTFNLRMIHNIGAQTPSQRNAITSTYPATDFIKSLSPRTKNYCGMERVI